MESHLGDLPIPNGDHVAKEPGKYRDISSICGLGENTAGKYRKRAGKVYRDKLPLANLFLRILVETFAYGGIAAWHVAPRVKRALRKKGQFFFSF